MQSAAGFFFAKNAPAFFVPKVFWISLKFSPANADKYDIIAVYH
jgi:hypothetical protein